MIVAAIAMMFIEIALFIIVGKEIGVMNTLFLIFLTSVIGIVVVQKKGTKSFQTIRSNIQEGIAPGPALLNTLMIYIGGILLMTPGFLTDFIGMLLLFSWTRKLFKPIAYSWVRKKMKSRNMVIVQRY